MGESRSLSRSRHGVDLSCCRDKNAIFVWVSRGVCRGVAMESNCISVVMKTPCLYARVAESFVESAKESTCISVAMNNAILYGRAAESVPESATESAFVCIVHKPCFPAMLAQ